MSVQSKVGFQENRKANRIFRLLFGLVVLQMLGCAPTREKMDDQIYIHRGYFLNSGEATGANPTIRNPFFDWSEDSGDQLRSSRLPKRVSKYIGNLSDFPSFSQKVSRDIPAFQSTSAINLKVAAPKDVLAELRLILRPRNSTELHQIFSLCDACDQKPDIVIMSLCQYGRFPCFGSFSYDQYGQSGLRTGEVDNGTRIIRGTNTDFPRIEYFCPDGRSMMTMGGPIDIGTSRIPWFEIPEELSIQLLTGMSTNEVQRGQSPWAEQMSVLRTEINGRKDPLANETQNARVLSVFEGNELGCRNKKLPATVERFMTIAASSVKQPNSPRICIVSGHEDTPKAQAELIARCAEFSFDPMSGLNQFEAN